MIEAVEITLAAACAALVAWFAGRRAALPAPPATLPAASCATCADVAARCEKLEMAFPEWKLAVDGVLDEMDEVLDRVKRRKAVLDGAKRGQPRLLEMDESLDAESQRSAGKAAVLSRFRQ
jgi:hypothetical protein